MMNHKLAVLSIVMLATLVLVACTPVLASDTLRVEENVAVLDVVPRAIESVTVDKNVTSQNLNSDTPAEIASEENESISSAELDKEAAVANQQVALFTIEPLAAPCCPAPTPVKALDAAQSVPGVLAAELVDDATVKVHFDAVQTDPIAIASAINRAAFLVTVEELDAIALAAEKEE